MEITGPALSHPLPVSAPRKSSRRRFIVLLLFAAVAVLGTVILFSWLGANGLVPETVDESGRSLLNADYSPWGGNVPLIQLDIPRLATAAARGEGDWSENNAPFIPSATPTSTDVPPPTASPVPSNTPEPTATARVFVPTNPPPAPTDVPTSDQPPTVPSGDGSSGGATIGGGSDGGGSNNGGSSNDGGGSTDAGSTDGSADSGDGGGDDGCSGVLCP